jgi:antitoxin component YwqK of YwqJK toxin-antitoxin module
MREMKRLISIFILLSLSVCARAEVVRKVTVDASGVTAAYYNNGVECAREIFDSESNLLKRQGEIPDGVVKQYSASNVLVAEYTYKSGRKDGLVKKYSDSGKLKQEISYRAGRKSGVSRDYFNNGTLGAQYTYEAGKLNGVTKIYLADGKLFEEITYVDNVREGQSTTYYGSGRAGETAIYKAGKKDGISKVFFDADPPKAQFVYTYRDGAVIKSTEYNSDGTLKLAPGVPAQ